jgi:hypothetical protein
MKTFAMITMTVCSVLFSCIALAGNGRFAVHNDKGKWGYIDTTGKIIIAIQYEDAKEFSEGVAAVKQGGLWGYIDTLGSKVIDFAFTKAGPFSEGVAAAEKKDTMYTGYIDKSGRYVIAPVYIDACDFSEGVAAVRSIDGLRWGYIDKSGNYAIAPQFTMEAPRPFKASRAAVQVDKKWGYIDRKGTFVIQPQFFEALDFSEELAMVQELRTQRSIAGNVAAPKLAGGKCGYIDKNGAFVIPPAFDGAFGFSEGVAPVRLHNKWGYINTKGELVISLKFDLGECFSEGLAVVLVQTKPDNRNLFGYIDQSGNYVLQPVNYFNALGFSGTLAEIVTDDNKQIYINKSGNVVWNSAFSIPVK